MNHILVVVLKLTLSTMFGGNLSSFMYSAAGGTLSFIGMVLVKEIFKDNVAKEIIKFHYILYHISTPFSR